MMKRALVLIALLGCAKDADRDPPQHNVPVARVDAAPPKPATIVALPAADAAITQPVSATVLVAVKADGSAMMMPHDEIADVDLATLAPSAPISLDELNSKVFELQREVGARRAQPAKEPCASPPENEGFGVGISGFGAGNGSSWGRIGTGRRGTLPGEPVYVHAGMIGSRSMIGSCHDGTPLVLADAQLPAAKLLEVLTKLVSADLAVTTDGGTHARMLPITLDYTIGDTVPKGATLELGFTLRPDGARASAYRGTTPDEQTWTWTGDVDGLATAYHQALAVEALLGMRQVRLRLDGDVTTGALITAIANLLAGNVEVISIGEPIDAVVPHRAVGGGRGSVRGHDVPVPVVRIGQAKIEGDYDKATMRRYIKRDLRKIKYCYEKQLLAKPKLDGTVETAFTIGVDGRVLSPIATGLDDDLSTCIAAVLRTIEFPKPKDARLSTVKQAFTFHPSGG